MERRFRIWHEPIPELIDATLEQAIVRSCQYDRPPLRRWPAGRVGLVGDAAHPMLASLGQGACQAIEDAAALGDAVGAGPDVTVALQAAASCGTVLGRRDYGGPSACQSPARECRRPPASSRRCGEIV